MVHSSDYTGADAFNKYSIKFLSRQLLPACGQKHRMPEVTPNCDSQN